MSRNKWMRKLAGVMAATMTLSVCVLSASAASTTTTDNNAAEPTAQTVTENQDAGQTAPAETAGVLGANRAPGGAAVTAAVAPADDQPGVLGAARDRSPRTADGSDALLVMLAGIGFAGAGALTYSGKRRA